MFSWFFPLLTRSLSVFPLLAAPTPELSLPPRCGFWRPSGSLLGKPPDVNKPPALVSVLDFSPGVLTGQDVALSNLPGGGKFLYRCYLLHVRLDLVSSP